MDAQPLVEVHAHGVEIDVCTHCGGVWLDRGELEAIQAMRNNRGLVGEAATEVAAEVAYHAALNPQVTVATVRHGSGAIDAALEFVGEVLAGLL